MGSETKTRGVDRCGLGSDRSDVGWWWEWTGLEGKGGRVGVRKGGEVRGDA